MSISNLEVKINNDQGKSLSSILGKKNNVTNGLEQYNDTNKQLNRRNVYQPLSREKKDTERNLTITSNPRNTREDLNARTNFEAPNSFGSWNNNLSNKIKQSHSNNENSYNNLLSVTNTLSSTTETLTENTNEKNSENNNLTIPMRDNNERKWNRPIQSVIVHRYEKNSMAYIVNHFRREIYERGTQRIPENLHPSDYNAMNKFQKIFAQVLGDWKGLMDHMIKKFCEIDAHHINNDYYGYRYILSTHILNMSLSFIIIGGDTNCGDGIDNLLVTNIIPPEDVNNVSKPTIRQKIKRYFILLPKVMEKISREYDEILRYDREHTKCLENEEYATSLIQTLNSSIKQHKKDIGKASNKTDKKKLEESLSETQKSLELAIFNKNTYEKKIQKIIGEKRNKNISIKNIFNELIKCLNFNYFMHDIWCPALEYQIMPTFENKTAL